MTPIFDYYGEKEVLGFENYRDKELCKELEEALVPLRFCEE